jgi:ribosome-associated protein
MLEITPQLAIDENELDFDFVRSSGPGGQNVNKVATAVQLRFDLVHSPSLPESVRQRAMQLASNRLTNDGVLIITASSERSQLRNREQAVEQLVDLLRRAAKPPKIRRKTKPSAAAKRKRLEKKRRRSETKRNRRRVRRDEY